MNNAYTINLRSNGIFQIEYKHPETGNRIRKSLGTTDEKLASILARRHWENMLDEYDRGILVNDKELSKIFREYYDNEKSPYNRDMIKRHFVPFLNEKKIKVSNLKQHSLDEYYKWRKKQIYRGKHPSETTINRENCAISSFLKFVVKNNYLSAKRQITLEHQNVVPNRRPAFKLDEIREILATCKANYENTKKGDLRAFRKCLYDVVYFLVLTGMRDGSANETRANSSISLSLSQRYLSGFGAIFCLYF